ncbi:MAG: preprotein translocase subunit SecA [Alphaproteobacteria bacterium]|nr:preprotein translocase subunit SecA [Alphaproteobacteria bacterium]
MFGAIAKRLFGTAADRFVKEMKPVVDAVNALEPELEALDDEALRARTGWLKSRIKDGESLDDILVDAFATVREAAKRTLGQRHFDVQIMGGVVLHNGKISEMGTGEGKTLVATLPVYLNALEEKGVHVVTVNDYLAGRDAEWMGQIYRFLGLTVGCIQGGLDDHARRAAYACDVTYGTNNEFGFDYLRDNMKFALADMVQREFWYAIVDEVDSILIDEARTPLIISGPSEDKTDLYGRVDEIIPDLTEDDYEKDEKARSIALTDEGAEHAENLLRDKGILAQGNLYDLENIALIHHVNQGLRAHQLFQKDVHYLVRDDRVHLIDEFTGRVMDGRRLSDGLHQAIEAREHVTVQNESQTLASITYQNYFRLYPKLAGMTGTAMTEAEEFGAIYGLAVVAIPPNLPQARLDADDEVYRTEEEKNEAIIELIEECHARQQPVLVGTVSIEKSEALASLLKKQQKVKAEVLNAKQHEREAYIIAQAGVPGAVTIATNMAGRGTDIQLGGNPDFVIEEKEKTQGKPINEEERQAIRADIEAKRKVALEAGGLCVLGTERHESRRIDNQLRGRSGRQGDPGSSRFFLSLQDDLMRIFGSERMDSMLQRLGLERGEAIIHPWINKAIEKAQQKVEARNFDIRKNLLQYDDVMNDQRKAIFDQRKEVMSSEDVSEFVTDMRHEVIEDLVDRALPERAMAEQWDVAFLHEESLRLLSLDLPYNEWAEEEGIANEEIQGRVIDASNRKMAEKSVNVGTDVMRRVEKSLVLQMIDAGWKDHLQQLDFLRASINLRAYAQKQPLLEYQKESFSMFQTMLEGLRERVTEILSRVEIKVEPTADQLKPVGPTGAQLTKPLTPDQKEARRNRIDEIGQQRARPRVSPDQRDPNNPESWGKVARNEPCPCGSGKKYKHCHGVVGSQPTSENV